MAGCLTPLQLYSFETSGWLVLRGVLGADSDPLEHIAAELDAGGERAAAMVARLTEHPSLVAALSELMDDPTLSRLPGELIGDEQQPAGGFFSKLNFNNAPRPFELLETPVLHEGTAEGQPQPPLQQWAGGHHDPSRAYSHDRGTRVCSAVRCVWVLPPRQAMLSQDAGHRCYALIPGSHTAEQPTPSSILRADYDDTELVTRPLLRVGDLVLHAATVVHAARLGTGASGPGDGQSSPAPPRLLAADFVTTLTGNWTAEGPDLEHPPEWLQRLSATQQAALGLHRTGASTVHDAATNLSVLAPSLARTRGESLRAYEERAVSEAARMHPPVPAISDGGGREEDAVEMYQWDCCGHLILRNVMDPSWLHTALAAIELLKQQPESDSVAGAPEVFDPLPAGALLGLPEPYAAAFARMLDHPAITRRLQWILGPGWVVEGPPAPTTANAGGPPLAIHSGGAPTTPINLIRTKHGRNHCEVVKVAWQLRDVNLNGREDGGYICIPGSHRARRQLPFGTNFQREDPMADANLALREDGHLQLLPMRAGDVCIFMAASQTHGAAGWRDELGRRTVIYGVSSPCSIYATFVCKYLCTHYMYAIRAGMVTGESQNAAGLCHSCQRGRTLVTFMCDAFAIHRLFLATECLSGFPMRWSISGSMVPY